LAQVGSSQLVVGSSGKPHISGLASSHTSNNEDPVRTLHHYVLALSC